MEKFCKPTYRLKMKVVKEEKEVQEDKLYRDIKNINLGQATFRYISFNVDHVLLSLAVNSYRFVTNKLKVHIPVKNNDLSLQYPDSFDTFLKISRNNYKYRLLWCYSVTTIQVLHRCS